MPDKIQDKKHAENVSCKNIVLEEKQGLPDSSFEEGNEQQKGGSWTRNTKKPGELVPSSRETNLKENARSALTMEATGRGHNNRPKNSLNLDAKHVSVHPQLINTNATCHKWAFGAIAELVDNAISEKAKAPPSSASTESRIVATRAPHCRLHTMAKEWVPMTSTYPSPSLQSPPRASTNPCSSNNRVVWRRPPCS